MAADSVSEVTDEVAGFADGSAAAAVASETAEVSFQGRAAAAAAAAAAVSSVATVNEAVAQSCQAVIVAVFVDVAVAAPSVMGFVVTTGVGTVATVSVVCERS